MRDFHPMIEECHERDSVDLAKYCDSGNISMRPISQSEEYSGHQSTNGYNINYSDLRLTDKREGYAHLS